ncbi:DAK2 domain-containing protein [Paenibacillus sp. J2TS4]|uniref:DAK2 domain-containing protein n=1 Tax=Paenibacillus sp. J2TS4 TaxID=2807194 RepID=UPI001BCC1B89|nr:DAK2 domain-containing protein [Paenibacillus sp. J2TS4]
MMMSGAARLKIHVNQVNALNVFPVPDGDTGTNMNLTMSSGMEELQRRKSSHIGQAAEALSKGLLMGARGNSGVILSQLFRGFGKAVHDFETINAQQFAAALQQGVDTAYQAVVKPVEGTVLTVARETARHAVSYARRTDNLAELMREVLSKSVETLNRTPDMLPVLKQVGVVDAGGKGLVIIYEGMLAALTGEFDQPADLSETEASIHPLGESLHEAANAQSMLATEDIEFGYCTEFMVNLVPGKVPGYRFEETKFRSELEKFGDSLLVVADDDLVKIHIHAEYPGEVMNYAMNYGDLTRIKIENMREQHSHILLANEYETTYASSQSEEVLQEEVPSLDETRNEPVNSQPYGFVTVSVGQGISDIFESLGADEMIAGGQTMNPSTEDIVQAVRRVRAETVFILPNNSNIIMAAQQAKELVEDKQIVVIPTKTIPQGMAAMLAFQERADVEANTATMTETLGKVRSGQVTHAVRNSSIDGMEINEGDYLGIMDGTIVSAQPDLLEACKQLLERMLEGDGEIVTVLTGEEATAENTSAIQAYLEEAYPEVEIEVHPGGQPIYFYLFSVE